MPIWPQKNALIAHVHPLCTLPWWLPGLPQTTSRPPTPHFCGRVLLRPWGTSEVKVLSETNAPHKLDPQCPPRTSPPADPALGATAGEPLKPHTPHTWHLTPGQPSGPGQTSASDKSLPHPNSSPAGTPAGGPHPRRQGCLLHWENQSGSGVWHQAKQTD